MLDALIISNGLLTASQSLVVFRLAVSVSAVPFMVCVNVVNEATPAVGGSITVVPVRIPVDVMAIS